MFTGVAVWAMLATDGMGQCKDGAFSAVVTRKILVYFRWGRDVNDQTINFLYFFQVTLTQGCFMLLNTLVSCRLFLLVSCRLFLLASCRLFLLVLFKLSLSHWNQIFLLVKDSVWVLFLLFFYYVFNYRMAQLSYRH